MHFKNIQVDVLDLSNEKHIDHLQFDENCRINVLILPDSCRSIYGDGVLKEIHFNAEIERICCTDCGIENVVTKEPLTKVREIHLSYNKLTKLDMKIAAKPSELNISYNKITEIVHRLPFTWFIMTEGNPIELMTREFINYWPE